MMLRTLLAAAIGAAALALAFWWASVWSAREVEVQVEVQAGAQAQAQAQAKDKDKAGAQAKPETDNWRLTRRLLRGCTHDAGPLAPLAFACGLPVVPLTALVDCMARLPQTPAPAP